jgi:ABC-type branched-subunit amino acid transport system substrate-binding protein
LGRRQFLAAKETGEAQIRAANAEEKAANAAVRAADPTIRRLRHSPNSISLGGYDGMHLIYEALRKTGGKTSGDAMLAAMRGMKWESPRGPMSIDPETRNVVRACPQGRASGRTTL